MKLAIIKYIANNNKLASPKFFRFLIIKSLYFCISFNKIKLLILVFISGFLAKKS